MLTIIKLKTFIQISSAVDRSLQSSLSDARDALINVAIDILSAYKLTQSSSGGGLVAPGSLKLLPLYIIALLKSVNYQFSFINFTNILYLNTLYKLLLIFYFGLAGSI